jgi:glycosyltransferase involved in cell wall biosynthesis
MWDSRPRLSSSAYSPKADSRGRLSYIVEVRRLTQPVERASAPAGGTLFLFWCREGSGSGRGEHLARALDAASAHVWRAGLAGSLWKTPLRYLLQALDTARILREQRPRVVCVQLPPVFPLLQVWWYARRTGAQIIADNHTSILDGRWRVFHWLQKPLARRIRINLVHNEANAELLRGWGAAGVMLLKSPAVTAEEILDPNADISAFQNDLDAPGLVRVLMVNRFAVDDAWREVFAAARITPEARFFVTGDPARAGISPDQVPGNVVLTGLLPKPVFIALMAACDVTLSLTLRPDTLLWSIRESLALGKPFVASRAPVMLAEFDGLGLFTDHSPGDMRARILEAHAQRDTWRGAMADYIVRDQERFLRQTREIQAMRGIGGPEVPQER